MSGWIVEPPDTVSEVSSAAERISWYLERLESGAVVPVAYERMVVNDLAFYSLTHGLGPQVWGRLGVPARLLDEAGLG